VAARAAVAAAGPEWVVVAARAAVAAGVVAVAAEAVAVGADDDRSHGA